MYKQAPSAGGPQCPTPRQIPPDKAIAHLHPEQSRFFSLKNHALLPVTPAETVPVDGDSVVAACVMKDVFVAHFLPFLRSSERLCWMFRAARDFA